MNIYECSIRHSVPGQVDICDMNILIQAHNVLGAHATAMNFSRRGDPDKIIEVEKVVEVTSINLIGKLEKI